MAATCHYPATVLSSATSGNALHPVSATAPSDLLLRCDLPPPPENLGRRNSDVVSDRATETASGRRHVSLRMSDGSRDEDWKANMARPTREKVNAFENDAHFAHKRKNPFNSSFPISEKPQDFRSR